jgi:hypothetical protein
MASLRDTQVIGASMRPDSHRSLSLTWFDAQHQVMMTDRLQIPRICCEQCSGDGDLSGAICEMCGGHGYFIPTKSGSEGSGNSNGKGVKGD